MDDYLGRPSVDPHGDPIPSAKGKVNEVNHESLADCAVETQFRVARVIDQDPAFLQFVERCGLMPGTSLVVQVRDKLADAVWVRPGEGRPGPMGPSAAAENMGD
jgi:DtxR family Mn-dependent transcriptional regulator